jgi:hypothetical protein
MFSKNLRKSEKLGKFYFRGQKKIGGTGDSWINLNGTVNIFNYQTWCTHLREAKVKPKACLIIYGTWPGSDGRWQILYNRWPNAWVIYLCKQLEHGSGAKHPQAQLVYYLFQHHVFAFNKLQCLYRWSCGYCYSGLLVGSSSSDYYIQKGYFPDRQTTGTSSSFPCAVSAYTSSGQFLCLLTLATEHCLLCDIVLGCDWFTFCSTAIPGDTITSSDYNTVLDFSLLIRACLWSQSGESFNSCYFFLIISKSTSWTIQIRQSSFNVQHVHLSTLMSLALMPLVLRIHTMTITLQLLFLM